MTDQQLLELAAKAAGIEIFIDEDEDFYRVKTSGNRRFWNPLVDDGDALRLAVKLHISIALNRTGGYTTAIYGYSMRLEIKEMHNNDPSAATRRAIVWAAAEIGKTIGEQA